MKKVLIGIGIALVVLVLAVVIGARFFLDGAIKRGVEAVGPKLTKVDVKLDEVHVSLLSGSGKIKGLVVGNPEGYKTPQAISVGSATLGLKPGSLLSDKIVINKIELISPEITFEGGLTGNNLSKILANLEEATSGGGTNTTTTPEEQKAASKKLQVDDFLISGAKVHVTLTDLGGSSGTVTLPQIHLTNLGQGPDGITAADLSRRVMEEIVKETTKAVAASAGDIGKMANELTKDLGKNLGNVTVSNAGSLGQTVGGLFKRNTATNAVGTNAPKR